MASSRRFSLKWALALTATVLGFGLAATAWAAGVWSAPVQLDTQSAGTFGSYDVACPTAALCFGVAGSAVNLQDGGSTVQVYARDGAEPGGHDFDLNPPWQTGEGLTLNSLQCPTAGFCAGIVNYSYADDDTDDFDYDIVVSSNPAGGAGTWTFPIGAHPNPAALSCPSASLCVAGGGDGLYVSAQPATNTWTAVTTSMQFVAVSCPSTAFCAAVDGSGDIWTSTDPTGGSADWTTSGPVAPLAARAKQIAAANADAINNEANDDYGSLPFACSGPSFCVADPGSAKGLGSVVVSSDPGGAQPWSAVHISSTHLPAIGCVPGGSCVVGDLSGHLITSPPPGAASSPTDAAAWTSVATAQTGGIFTVNCTAQRCVAAGLKGGAPLIAAVPSTGAWQWTPLRDGRHDSLTSIACPTSHECVGADAASIYRTLHPTSGASAWSHVRHPKLDGPIYDTACWSASLCLATVSFGAGTGNGAFGGLYRFNPDSAKQAFTYDPNNTGINEAMDAVTCAQGTCVAGSPGSWYQSSNPISTRSWHQVTTPHFDVTCLTATTHCVALPDAPTDALGGPDLAVAATRSGPWHTVAVDPGQEITGLACTTKRVCVVVDASGRMLISTTPTGPASGWKLGASDPDGFNGVACPTAQRCLAVDDNGRIVAGRPVSG